MKRLGIGIVLAMAASSAGSQTPPLDPAAQVAAKAYYGCLHKGAEQLDDRRSDAASIAQGVVALCRAKERDLAVVMGKGDFQQQQSYQEYLAGKAIESATAFVLAVRTQRSKHPVKPPPKAKAKGEAI